jgi:transglutaminase-like putative cysteine protease
VSVSGPWQSAQERIGKALSGLESPSWIVREEFGETLSLQAGVATTEEIVLEAEPFKTLREGGRFYWRARTYDTYRNGRWSNRTSEEFEFDPREGTLPLPESDSRQDIEVSFTVWSTIPRVLYLPSQPIWASRSSQVLAKHDGEALVDVSSFLSTQSVQRGESYRAIGLVALPTVAELRAAGSEYPSWVEERYLQVPESISDRTRELTRQIAGDLATPYDQASAITQWLRENIEYQRVTDAPPSEREPLDWFLFDYRTGFCNYYASAEVIMLRSLGVPARMATGYAQGAYQDGRDVYEVIASDFHAWPEVFFPNIGWVEFEPTVSQPELPRLPGDPEAGDGSNGLRPGVESQGAEDDFKLGEEDNLAGPIALRLRSSAFGPRSQPLVRLLGVSIVVLILLFALWTRVDAGWWVPTIRWLRKVTRAVGIERVLEGMSQVMEIDGLASEAYARWLAWWPRLGLIPQASQTPRERATIFRKAQPALADDAEALATLYSAERFGGLKADTDLVRKHADRLQSRLWRHWLRELGLPVRTSDEERRLHDLRNL